MKVVLRDSMNIIIRKCIKIVSLLDVAYRLRIYYQTIIDAQKTVDVHCMCKIKFKISFD